MIFLFILFVLFVGYVIVDTSKQEKLLDNEISSLLELDLTKDSINKNIVTKDEYAIIEKTIKDYLRDYSDNLKNYKDSIDNFDFNNMFSANNFDNDGPDFIESKGKLSKLKENLNSSLDNLVKYSSEEYIMKIINDKKLDSMYVSKYKEYMLGNGANSFNDTVNKEIKEIKDINEEFNNFLDDCYKLYDFMSNNRNYWSIDKEKNIVYFDNDKLINEYNALLNKIIKDAGNLDNGKDDSKENSDNVVGSV